MTQDEIIEMAREAGLDWDIGWVLNVELPNRFETFANLVAAKERRECAKLAAEIGYWGLVHEIEARGEQA